MIFALTHLACFLSTAVATAPTTQPFTRQEVIYGRKDGMALTMDVLTPTKQNGAAVIWVVSGGWFSSHDAINPATIKMFCNELLKRGYVVIPVVHGSQPRYAIPDAIADMNRAVRFIRFHARDYGIDPNRIGVFGGSAGGHLSLMLGVAPKAPKSDALDPVDRQPSAVQAVCAFFPPTDFLNYGEPGKRAIGDGVLKDFPAPFEFRELTLNGRLAQIIDPERREKIAREISPIYHVTAQSAPTLLIHGDADRLVPIQQSQLIVGKMRELNVPVELIVRPGRGHGWLHDLGDMSAFADWFDRYLSAEPRATSGPTTK